ncbi:MAG: acyltransferase [Lachnospiraceae bacterium]|nr:acyltransferase [Lachnospiraceae bacterium]
MSGRVLGMRKLLEKRNTIYGVCAIWIVLFHTFRRIGMPYIPVVTNIVGVGNISVDIFFFFSGLCLALSVEKHNYLENGWKGYFRRRLTRILVPYLIIGIPYYIWDAIFESSGGIVRRIALFFANISSASFWIKGTLTTWYAYAILVFYVLFPILYRVIKKSKASVFYLLTGMIAFAIVSAYIPILKNSMIMWARLPIFTIGIAAALRERRKLTGIRHRIIASFVIVIALGLLISISEISETFTIPQVYRFLLYIPMTLALLTILTWTGGKLRFFEMVGTLTFEIYLVHNTLFHPFKYYGIMETTGYWLYLIMPVIAFFISWLVKKAEERMKIAG